MQDIQTNFNRRPMPHRSTSPRRSITQLVVITRAGLAWRVRPIGGQYHWNGHTSSCLHNLRLNVEAEGGMLSRYSVSTPWHEILRDARRYRERCDIEAYTAVEGLL